MKFFDRFKFNNNAENQPVKPEDQKLESAEPAAEPEPELVASVEPPKKPVGNGITQEDIDRIWGTQTLDEQVAMSPQEIAKIMGEDMPEPPELTNMEGEAGPAFGDKLNQKMKDIYEKAKETSSPDVKERESQIVRTAGKAFYDSVGTIAGTKAITDWALYGLHKLGVKSSIKGDVHKYYAEDEMERALVGITNHAIELRQNKEGKNTEKDSKEYEAYKNSKEELVEATNNFKAKVDNLNVSEEKKKELRKEFAMIMKDLKFQEMEIQKGESEKFEQVMRHYTGNKISGLKLWKDWFNSALSLTGFATLRGASYLSFSAIEKGKETWKKKSREDNDAKFGDKMKAALKGVTIDSAKETFNEFKYGRKEGKSAEAEERKENFKIEKNYNIEMLKQQLEEEGMGVFGRTWRVNWEKTKNINPEEVKRWIVRIQAIGKVARVIGVSLVGFQAYETDGGNLKEVLDRLIDGCSENGVVKTLSKNSFGNLERLWHSLDGKIWKKFYHDIADKFHHTDEGLGSSGVKTFNIEKDGTSTPAVHETELGGSGASAGSSHVEVNSARINELRDQINLVRAAHNTPGAAPMTMEEQHKMQIWEKELNSLSSDAHRVPVSGEKNIEAQKVTVENRSQPKHFQIAENVEIKRGDSVWTLAEKHLEGNKDFLNLGDGKSQTYNIDRVKDVIMDNPEKYGLSKALERILGKEYSELKSEERMVFLKNLNESGKLEPVFKKLTIKELNSVRWQNAFDETFSKQGIIHLPKDHRGGGDHHHSAAKPRLAKPSGRMFTEGENIRREGVELPKVPGVAETHVEVPPVDDSKIHIDSHLTIDKGSQFANEYQTWGKASAEDFLHGRFGEPIVAPEHYPADGKLDHERPIIHKQADALEISNRNLLRERLQNAQSLIGDPKKGETVADFMARYNLKNADVSGSIYDHLKNEAVIGGNAGMKAESWAIIDKMPSELKKSIFENFAANKGIAFGYVKMFFGDRSGVKDGIKSFFDYRGEVNPEDIKIKSDGSILYENAFGKQGYDLQISREKIGVDGPLWNNLPKNRMSLDNIGAAKRFILSGKTMSDNIDEMSGKGHEEVKVSHEAVVSETAKAHVEAKVKAPETVVSEKHVAVEPKPKVDINVSERVVTEHKTGKVIESNEVKKPGKVNIDISKQTVEPVKSDVQKAMETIDKNIAAKDRKHFNELFNKYKDYSSNEIEKVVEEAKQANDHEKKIIAEVLRKVEKAQQAQDEKDF